MSSSEAVPALEKHYRITEIAKAWNLSADLVRKLFSAEPDVLKITKHNRRRRIYITLAIPESVLARVHRRLQGAAR